MKRNTKKNRGNNELEMRNAKAKRAKRIRILFRFRLQPNRTEQNIARHFNKSELPNDDEDENGRRNEEENEEEREAVDENASNFRLMLMLAKYPHRTHQSNQPTGSILSRDVRIKY